jgi:glycosyltransferase involved in cell wall biosynthesis
MTLTNMHIYPSAFKNETRIMKEVNTLLKYQVVNKIILVGILEKGLKDREIISNNIVLERIKIPIKKNNSLVNFILKYFLFQILVIWKYRNIKIDIVNCHNLSVLLIGVIFKRIKKCKLVYDAHELETEVHNSKGFKKRIGKWFERKLIYQADQILVVNNSIRSWYLEKYHLSNIHVARNIPNWDNIRDDSFGSNLFRQTFNIYYKDIIFLYQGLLADGRGIDIIIDVFKKCEKSKKVIFMGYGSLVSELIELSKNFENIFYHLPVNQKELPAYTRSADIGLSLITNSCLSNYYLLPNKVFEYYLSGIPQIASKFPEIEKIIDNNKYGWCIEPNYKNLLELVEGLTQNEINEKMKNVMGDKNRYSWLNEEKNIIKMYNLLT